MKSKEVIERLREVFGRVVHLDRDNGFILEGRSATGTEVDRYIVERDSFPWLDVYSYRKRLGFYLQAFEQSSVPLVFINNLGPDTLSPGVYLRNTLGVTDDASILKFKFFLQMALIRAINPGIECPYMFVLLGTQSPLLRFFFDLFPVGFMCPDRVEFYDPLFVKQWVICFNQFRFSEKQYPLFEQFITRLSDRSGKCVYSRQFVVCGTTTRRDFANGLDGRYFVTIEAPNGYTPYLHGVKPLWYWVYQHRDIPLDTTDVHSPEYTTESLLDRVVRQYVITCEYPIHFNAIARWVWEHFPQYSAQEIMDSAIRYLGHPDSNHEGATWLPKTNF